MREQMFKWMKMKLSRNSFSAAAEEGSLLCERERECAHVRFVKVFFLMKIILVPVYSSFSSVRYVKILSLVILLMIFPPLLLYTGEMEYKFQG